MKIGIIRTADYFPESKGSAGEINVSCRIENINDKTRNAYDSYFEEEMKNGNNKPDAKRSFYDAASTSGVIYYEGEPDSNHTEISGTIVDIPKELIKITVPTTAGVLQAEYCSCESQGIVIGFKPKGEKDYFVDVVLAEVKNKDLCENRDYIVPKYPTDKATPDDVCVYLYSDPNDEDWQNSFVLNSNEVYNAINQND